MSVLAQVHPPYTLTTLGVEAVGDAAVGSALALLECELDGQIVRRFDLTAAQARTLAEGLTAAADHAEGDR